MQQGSSIVDGALSIPGFYYDIVRKRYFKHAHVATGGQYTASAVIKRQKRDDLEAKQAVATSRSIRKPAVALRSYLTERSLRSTPILAAQRSWAKSIRYDPGATRRLSLGSRTARFAIDEESQHLYVATARILSLHDLGQPLSLDRSVESQIMQMHPVAPLRSEMSSLTWDQEKRYLLCTSVGDGHRPAEFVLRHAGWARSSVCRTFDGTLWCSASSPGLNRFIAAGSGILLCDEESEISRNVRPTGNTDIMGIDFLNAHILLCGCRNGNVQLFDIRSSAARTSSRFRHGIGVAQVKTLSMNQVIVSGLNSSLCTYDLRYLKPEMPLVNFSGHENEFDMQVNSIAVDNDILVATQSSKCFRMWNLRGDYLGQKDTKSTIHDVSFSAHSLYTLGDGKLIQWSC